MKRLILFLGILLSQTFCFSQEPTDRLNQEVAGCVAHLQTFDEYTRPYIKYFSMYNVEDANIVFKHPTEEAEIRFPQKDLYKRVLDFWIHSVSYGNTVRPCEPVPHSNSLFWVDIRNYAWTIQAWENVISHEPYFKEPWIDSQLAYQMRLLGGNSLCRADWFIVNISDTTKQVDLDPKETPLYYELLYSTVGIPTTVDDFMGRWGVDKEKILSLQILSGSLIDEGESGISRHNRQLSRARTELGYYYETSDVKTSTGERDYLEVLEPGVFGRRFRDAGEQITTNKVGLQVYFLSDSKGNRVEFADATLVWDRTDTRDVRVKTARSCVICHAEGLNLPKDGFKDILESGVVELHTYDYALQNALEAFYAGGIEQDIEDDRILYQRAVERVCGIDGPMLVRLFRHVLNKYESDINLEIAATECGISIEQFTKLVAEHTTSGRISSLFVGLGIPRQSWEDKNGGFTQAMLLIKGVQLATAPHVLEIVEDCTVYNGKQKLGVLHIGDRVELLSEKSGWYRILYNGKPGYIKPHFARLVE